MGKPPYNRRVRCQRLCLAAAYGVTELAPVKIVATASCMAEMNFSVPSLSHEAADPR